ncbi:gpW family head-tail joining protein [Edwardsiella tarda]|uniref:gpW family head-tail joining protein n=1 Tax=Edwardsiella tarda TaxID=636 RepID=UPI000BE2BA55|nr:gpW family head-tail joining protein [Edwardsiella tarda]ATI62797.1 phage tail protein [Edwardsiella tarda]
MVYTHEMLTEACQALHELLTGRRVVSISKGGRQVQFSQANIQELRRYIDEIEVSLGVSIRRRSPVGVML